MATAMKPGSIQTTTVATPDGVFVIAFSERGLWSLDFPDRWLALDLPEQPRGSLGAVEGPELQRWRKLTEQALLAALQGRRPAELPPLDWSGRTEFRRNVWNALLRIETGETRTYGEIAAEIGNPKAVRAVGRACGANPIPVLVPCHRVMAAGGRLGGFSGGLDWKRRLLVREGRCEVNTPPAIGPGNA